MEQLLGEAFVLTAFTAYRAGAKVRPEDQEGPSKQAEPE